jgi:pimeloyl-ACP methyl ester carboxylesterase
MDEFHLRPGQSPRFRRRTISTNGINMAIWSNDIGQAQRVAVVLLHGFPELAYSWRHQLEALDVAGYGVVAPDLRGYGETGPRGELPDYRLENLARDVRGLLDSIAVERAVVVGHDFGGALAWTFAREHSERTLGVVSLCTPYTRRTSKDLVQTVLQAKGPAHYMVTFQEPGVGESLLGSNIESTFRGLMRRPSIDLEAFDRLPERLRALPATLFGAEPDVMGEAILTEEELRVYVDAFGRTGFEGPLNWYRNLARNWVDTQGKPDRIDQPALMISAANDFFLPPNATLGMERIVADLEKHVVTDCGHWIQQERPREVNALLLDWLARRMVR